MEMDYDDQILLHMPEYLTPRRLTRALKRRAKTIPYNIKHKWPPVYPSVLAGPAKGTYSMIDYISRDFEQRQLDLKVIQATNTVFPATTWNYHVDFVQIGQGPASNQRRGIHAYIYSIQVRFRLERVQIEQHSHPAKDVSWRCFLLLDTQTNGANPTSLVSVMTSDDVWAHQTIEGSGTSSGSLKRFHILADITGVLKPEALSEGGVNAFAECQGFTAVHNLEYVFDKPLDIVYTNTIGTFTGRSGNSLYMFAIYSGNETITIALHWQTRFMGS